jgi:hypothetical protein
MKVHKQQSIWTGIGLWLLGLTAVHAQTPKTGLILCKPEAWAPDSKAEVFEYASYQNHTGYLDVTFPNGRKEQVFSGTIVANIVYPKKAEYLNFSTDADREKTLNEIGRLKQLEAKYPVTETYLDPMIVSLQSEINQYASGDRKMNGVWLTKTQLDQSAGVREKETQGHAEDLSLPAITTRNGTVYHHVTVIKVEPDSLTLRHSDGVAKIDFEDLPITLREKYHYDTARAAAFKKAKLPEPKTGK